MAQHLVYLQKNKDLLVYGSGKQIRCFCHINDAVNAGYVACATSTSGITLNGPDNINIYPNPSCEKVQVSNLKNEKTELKIYDSKGKMVIQKTVLNEQKIDVSFLARGVYYMEFYTKTGIKTRQLIKE